MATEFQDAFAEGFAEVAAQAGHAATLRKVVVGAYNVSLGKPAETTTDYTLGAVELLSDESLRVAGTVKRETALTISLADLPAGVVAEEDDIILIGTEKWTIFEVELWRQVGLQFCRVRLT